MIGISALALAAFVMIVWSMYKDNKDGRTITGGGPSGAGIGSGDAGGNEDSYVMKVINQLNDNGIELYGRDGCPWCSKQKEVFGSLFDDLTYNDCGEGKCPADIKGVPTWRGQGKELSGYADLNKLVDHFNLRV